jgi:hypothetical protein
VIEDCCASPNADWHRFSVEKMLPLFGTLTTTDAFVSAISGAAA